MGYERVMRVVSRMLFSPPTETKCFPAPADVPTHSQGPVASCVPNQERPPRSSEHAGDRHRSARHHNSTGSTYPPPNRKALPTWITKLNPTQRPSRSRPRTGPRSLEPRAEARVPRPTSSPGRRLTTTRRWGTPISTRTPESRHWSCAGVSRLWRANRVPARGQGAAADTPSEGCSG
jgi:hypothetical protein